MARDELLDQLLLHNPVLDRRPATARATPQQEDDMRHWASRGLRRVRDLLDASLTRLLTFDELLQRHPGLNTAAHPTGRARQMHRALLTKLRPWSDTIASPALAALAAGDFRSAADGQVLCALRDARPKDRTVPAEVYEQQPSTGCLAPTGVERRLPARRNKSTPCSVVHLGEHPDHDHVPARPADDPHDVAAADAGRHTHLLLAPPGCRSCPDPRLIGWAAPATPARVGTVRLASATNRSITQTYAAQEYATPRVFEGSSARYAALLAGLSAPARERCIADIAAGIAHPAIPPDEALHLCITLHHGHMEGATKCAGDEACCSRCLANARSVEETAVHKYHACPEILHGVWQPVARAWHRATGDTLDLASQLLVITGLRRQPPHLSEDALKKWRDLEPAWRLLHSVVLLQVHRARCAAHAAYHAVPRRDPPKNAAPKAILAAIKHRFQQRLSHEHMRAVHTAGRATFQRHWVSTGVATDRGRGPRANLFVALPTTAHPAPGVHLRVAAAFVPGTPRRQPAAGWALSAHAVAADGTATLRFQAHGAVPARSTHGAAHVHVPPRHTQQAAQHTAAAAALRCLEQTPRLGRLGHITLTLSSPTTCLDLEAPTTLPVAQPAPPRAARTVRGKRQRVPAAPPQPHQRKRQHAALVDGNRATLALLRLCNNNNILLQTYQGAAPLDLYATAQHAASLADTHAHIQTATRRLSHPLWQQSRTWDPDD